MVWSHYFWFGRIFKELESEDKPKLLKDSINFISGG
jgi:hypothetical protein